MPQHVVDEMGGVVSFESRKQEFDNQRREGGLCRTGVFYAERERGKKNIGLFPKQMFSVVERI